MRRFLASVIILAGSVGLAYWYLNLPRGPQVVYRTTAVRRGDVSSVVTATGTIEPEEVVDVGAQVAGRIQTLGRDPADPGRPIDYGSLVDEGTILAEIDKAIYASQVEQAKASVQRSQAEVEQQRLRREQLEREWNRSQNFRRTQSISEADLDLARTNYQMAEATVSLAEASLSQALASLHQAEINLGYTTIRSPVKGVIIDRRVNVGQTVVASLNAPSMFLIAKDLKRLQVWASVNEADIGQIYLGQPVRFTVDAHPGETFQGTVAQIRLNATMTQNVVTYTVVVATDNSSGKLIPYLTASLLFERASRSDVLLVSNVALRWQPRRSDPSTPAAGIRDPDRSSAGEQADKPRGRVWIRSGGEVRPLDVTLGLTDGVVTEIEGGGLTEGIEVVTADLVPDAGGKASPFAPRMFGGQSAGGGQGAASSRGGGR